MKKSLAALVLLVGNIVGVVARIDTCSIAVSSLHVHITSGTSPEYAVALPVGVEKSVRITEQDNHLYVNETFAAQGQRIDLRLPHGTKLDLALKHKALVTIEDASAPIASRMRSGGGVFVKDGVCVDLSLDMQGGGTVVCDEAQVINADIVADGEANIVIGLVKNVRRAEYDNGVCAWINGEYTQAGHRKGREAFSIARSYKAAGQKLNDSMALYDVCATEKAHISTDDCQAYAGNPFSSDNDQVKEVLSLLRQDLAAPGMLATVYKKIRVLPDECQTEREVCGAMVCRRLMLCALSQPIGHGLVSPLSLLAVKTVPTSMRENVLWMYEEMAKGAYAVVRQKGTDSFGEFGDYFKRSATSMTRFRERLAQRRTANKLRWVPFLGQLYKETSNFIMTGARNWQRSRA